MHILQQKYKATKKKANLCIHWQSNERQHINTVRNADKYFVNFMDS